MKKSRITRFSAVGFILIIVFASVLITGCSKDYGGGSSVRFTELSDFEGCAVGSQTGTIFDSYMDRVVDNLKFKYYDDISSEILALKNGDVDAIGLDEPVAKLAQIQNPDTEIFSDVIQTDSYGYIFDKGNPLAERFSEVINEFNEDGTIDELQEKWFSGDENKMQIDFDYYDNYFAPNGELRLYCDSTQVPMSYVSSDGKPAGYEIELVMMIAKKLGKKAVITQVNFSSLITAVTTGKADVACGCITITDERKESVDFSDTHYVGGIVLLCRADDLGAGEAATNEVSLKDSFNKNFVKENRYKMILSGLGITVLISLIAMVFGTIIGFGICLIRRSKNQALSKLAAAFIRIIQGIPVLVLLLVLYYVVFASTGFSGVVVSIVAFALNFGVNSAEIMRTGIDGIGTGQWEAASSIGLSKYQTFAKVIMPQAIRRFLPAYKGEFINMLKMTSVVGYIAVVDLTKASDIIRSHTYEALFPLITVAIIYFLLAWLLTLLIGLIEIKINHKSIHIDADASDNSLLITDDMVAETGASGREIIRFEHIKKVYETATPLEDINTVVNSGETVTIIGPSGTGKSTLLRLINKLEEPTSGKIYVNGKDMDDKNNCNEELKKIGMLFQSFNLFPHLTVIENIMLAPVCVNKVSKQTACAEAYDLLKLVGLAGKANEYPDELSGGQMQRVAIARTLAMKPQIVLLDEPTSALDPSMVAEVLSVIRQLSRLGMTMMIVTHEMRFAKAVSDRVFYLDEGIVFEEGSPAQIFDNPEKENTRRFVRRLRVFEEKITSRDFDFIGINTAFENFGRKNLLSQKMIYNLQVVFEELAVSIILPRLGIFPIMNVVVEYGEDSCVVNMLLRYNGGKFDPSGEGDEIQMRLIKSAASEIKYSYYDDEEAGNEVEITLKDDHLSITN